MVIYLKKKIFFALSTIFSIILGIFIHFIYNILHKPFILGLFVPINESVFEHLKLVLIPLTVFGIIYSFVYGKKENNKNIWNYISIAVILSMIFIPLMHYLYIAIIKNTSTIFDIVLYILSVIFSYIYIYIKNEKDNEKDENKRGILLILLLYFIFVVFTICPPRVELFKDPINNTYGIFWL